MDCIYHSLLLYSFSQPTRPPIPYVRLAPNMYLKENHKHVGSDGKVYLPYLHEWRLPTHNLVELVVAMSSVFSAEPPVFTKRPGRTSGSSSVHSSATSNTSNNNSHSFATAEVHMTDEEAIAAVAAAEAQEQAERERRRLAEETRREQEALAEQRRIEAEERRQEVLRRQEEEQLNEQRAWEARRTGQVRQQVVEKIRVHLAQQARQTQLTIANDIERDMNRLRLAKEQKIDVQLQDLKEKEQYLQQQLAVAEEKKEDLQEWIAQAEEAKKTKETQPVSIDDKVVPASSVHAQMMDLAAENAALTDALYFLDKALFQGHLECDVHLKQVRKLAKKQFLVRAHLIKIHQVLIESAPTAKR